MRKIDIFMTKIMVQTSEEQRSIQSS